MAEYEHVQKGALKLKGDSGVKKKKKKKDKEKEAKKILEQISSVADTEAGSSSTQLVDKRTKAEKTFDKVKEKRSAKDILDKASKTHKERIMDFNEHLDTLTEHFDIPKVSWTK